MRKLFATLAICTALVSTAAAEQLTLLCGFRGDDGQVISANINVDTKANTVTHNGIEANRVEIVGSEVLWTIYIPEDDLTIASKITPVEVDSWHLHVIGVQGKELDSSKVLFQVTNGACISK